MCEISSLNLITDNKQRLTINKISPPLSVVCTSLLKFASGITEMIFFYTFPEYDLYI